MNYQPEISVNEGERSHFVNLYQSLKENILQNQILIDYYEIWPEQVNHYLTGQITLAEQL